MLLWDLCTQYKAAKNLCVTCTEERWEKSISMKQSWKEPERSPECDKKLSNGFDCIITSVFSDLVVMKTAVLLK